MELSKWLERQANSLSTQPDIQVRYGTTIAVNILARSDQQATQSAHEFSNALVADPHECALDLDFEVLVNGHDGLGNYGEPFDGFNLGRRLDFNIRS